MLSLQLVWQLRKENPAHQATLHQVWCRSSRGPFFVPTLRGGIPGGSRRSCDFRIPRGCREPGWGTGFRQRLAYGVIQCRVFAVCFACAFRAVARVFMGLSSWPFDSSRKFQIAYHYRKRPLLFLELRCVQPGGALCRCRQFASILLW